MATQVAAVAVVAAIGLGIGLSTVSSGGAGNARDSPGSTGGAGPTGATESAGLACSDFGALDAALGEDQVTPEQLAADLDQIALQASAAAGADPGQWNTLADDAAALDRAVASDSEESGADATTLAEACAVFDRPA